MRACFSKMDEEVNGSSGGGSDGKRKTVGSTTVLVVMGKEEVVVANCGVSRVVLGRGGVAVPLSEDHKPYRLDERERVEAIGGWITNRYGSDCLGGLGTSRSIDLGLFFQPFLLQTCYSNALRRTRLSRARHVKTRARDGTT
ncbi:probable protein phosphatase 2C 8 isoform X6 [Actinidia eriantha]|uniref:probable protein phosphatase 2C 8 isoform X6 n=2 Tax=Actinidia eriantha TaxID=165200 RepID=UPI0025830DDE|nr:probable protein phosphatase 2C 8 isoform X6 [Actinidia eriantha]